MCDGTPCTTADHAGRPVVVTALEVPNGCAGDRAEDAVDRDMQVSLDSCDVAAVRTETEHTVVLTATCGTCRRPALGMSRPVLR